MPIFPNNSRCFFYCSSRVTVSKNSFFRVQNVPKPALPLARYRVKKITAAGLVLVARQNKKRAAPSGLPLCCSVRRFPVTLPVNKIVAAAADPPLMPSRTAAAAANTLRALPGLYHSSSRKNTAALLFAPLSSFPLSLQLCGSIAFYSPCRLL